MRIATLALVLIALSMPVSASAQCGDCDRSGSVTLMDALTAAQLALGLMPTLSDGTTIPRDLSRCDPSRNGQIDILDALLIAGHVVGIFPVLICM